MRTRPDRRGEILASAARMFAVSGFHGVSIDELGAELGVSGPAIYRYFASKEAILDGMLVGISRQLLDEAETRVAELSGTERLAALIDFHVGFALEEPELIAVQYRDLGSASDKGRRLVRALQSQYVGIWVAALQEVYPDVAEQRARTSAQSVFGMLNQTPYLGRGMQAELPEILHDMAWSALAAACSGT